MQKFMMSLGLAVLLITPAFADFTTEVKTLEKADIIKLTDEKLIDAYLDVLVELEAIKTFHLTSGFSPKQYEEFKNVLKYRLQLLMEAHNRNLEIPQLGN